MKKTKKKVNAKQLAAEIQGVIDCEFNIDIACFQRSELERLRDKLSGFLKLKVATEDLELAENQCHECPNCSPKLDEKRN